LALAGRGFRGVGLCTVGFANVGFGLGRCLCFAGLGWLGWLGLRDDILLIDLAIVIRR
jgi:hypothetical protein